MKEKNILSQHDFLFCADWESCDVNVTYKPPWKSVGSTPKSLKLSPGRAYRVSVRPESTAADLGEILRVAPSSNIRTVRIPHGGPIGAADLGKALAKLKGIETVGMDWPYDAIGWCVNIGQARGQNVWFDLEKWPVNEVTAALGQIPRASELKIKMDEFKESFSLRPLFKIRGLKRIRVDHCSYSEQDLDWSGLSEQDKLQHMNVQHGFLNERFWNELGKLPQLRDIEMWWPEKATARHGSLSGLTSLKKLNGVCLFANVPEAFQAFAECPALEALHIDQCKIDDASAKNIGSMARVKDCYFWNTELTDAGMQALCRWPQVESLVLCENSDNPKRITRSGFEALANLQTLETLHLQGFEGVATAGWAALQRVPRLKRLKLMSCPAFDPMEAIGPLPGVEELSLSYCNSIGPAGFKQLQTMPRLRTLNLQVNRYRPHHIPLDEIAELQQLTAVFLGGLHKMADDQLGRLVNIRNLRELYLHEANRISDRGIAAIARLKNLRVVSLHMLPKLTDQTLQTLASLPRLDTLFLRCTGKITDKGFTNLNAVRRLTTLHLEYARNLTGDRLLQLARQLPLQELLVDSSPLLADADVLKLVDHPTLKRVAMRACKNVSEDCLKTIAQMRPDWKLPAFSFWRMM